MPGVNGELRAVQRWRKQTNEGGRLPGHFARNDTKALREAGSSSYLGIHPEGMKASTEIRSQDCSNENSKEDNIKRINTLSEFGSSHALKYREFVMRWQGWRSTRCGKSDVFLTTTINRTVAPSL
jgi:hypothetical protein